MAKYKAMIYFPIDLKNKLMALYKDFKEYEKKVTLSQDYTNEHKAELSGLLNKKIYLEQKLLGAMPPNYAVKSTQ